MLVLSRKPGESIHVSDGTEILLMSTRGDRVRLGLIHDGSIRVSRLRVGQSLTRFPFRVQLIACTPRKIKLGLHAPADVRFGRSCSH